MSAKKFEFSVFVVAAPYLQLSLLSFNTGFSCTPVMYSLLACLAVNSCPYPIENYPRRKSGLKALIVKIFFLAYSVHSLVLFLSCSISRIV